MCFVYFDPFIHPLAILLVIKNIQSKLGVGLVRPLYRAGGPSKGRASPITDGEDNVGWSLVSFLDV